MKKIVSVALCLMFASSAVFAQSKAASAGKSTASSAKTTSSKTKNGGAIAIGYTTGLSDADTIAIRFGVSDIVAIEPMFGFSVATGNTVFGFGGKVLFTLKEYSSFNLYGFGGMGLNVVSPTGADTAVTFGVNFGVGVEYFLARNLSISTEVGMGGAFAKGNSSFGTFGNWMSNLGFRYYFN